MYKTINYQVNFYGMTFEGRSDNEIDKHILYFGAHEKGELFMMRDLLRNIGPQAVAVDVGANIGQHSLFLSKYAAQVHSFEPYPPVLERMRRLVALNSISNIQIHPVGLGDTKQTLPFSPPDKDNLGGGSFVPDEDSKTSALTLEVVRGDDFFSEIGIDRLDLVKIDIEGFEKQAILGMRKTLAQHRPVIVMELNLGGSLSFQSANDFFDSFPDDYVLFSFALEDRITGNYELAESPFSSFKQLPSGGYYNVVVCPKEKIKFLSLEAQELDPLSQ